MSAKQTSAAVAYRWQWLTDEQRREAVASALKSALPSERARAYSVQNHPNECILVHRPDGSWVVLAALWPTQLEEVRIASVEERAK